MMPTHPHSFVSQPTVFYDGDCGICSRAILLADVIDHCGIYKIEPYQTCSESLKETYALNDVAFQKGIYLLMPSGKRYSGAFAVNRFLWSFFPYNVLIALLYLCPIFLLMEVIGYRLIADNRSRISGLLGLTACKLPVKKP